VQQSFREGHRTLVIDVLATPDVGASIRSIRIGTENTVARAHVAVYGLRGPPA